MIDIDDSVSNEAGRELQCGGRYFSLNFTARPPPDAFVFLPPVFTFGPWELPKRSPPKVATGDLGVVVCVWLLSLDPNMPPAIIRDRELAYIHVRTHVNHEDALHLHFKLSRNELCES